MFEFKYCIIFRVIDSGGSIRCGSLGRDGGGSMRFCRCPRGCESKFWQCESRVSLHSDKLVGAVYRHAGRAQVICQQPGDGFVLPYCNSYRPGEVIFEFAFTCAVHTLLVVGIRVVGNHFTNNALDHIPVAIIEILD